MNHRVALATCSELPDLDPDDQLLIEPLAALGITAEAAVWDDPAVDWASYELVVIRSTWDYVARHDDFIAWAKSVPVLANSASVVAWNTDKTYLRELRVAGVRSVPTEWIAPTDKWLPPLGEYVLKPAVSAGSKDTGRYGPRDSELAIAHVRRLQDAGRIVMMQPYLPAVDTYGETALLHFADPVTGVLTFSHAIRKGPMLTGPDNGSDELYVEEQIEAREATDAELALAAKALAVAPAGLLYARVDVIPGPGGEPALVELELTEPSVFLAHAPGAAERFAAAIAARL